MTRTVVFTETGEERAITRYCKRCEVSEDDFPMVVVSPTGMAHHCGDYGKTDCGLDATDEWYWWPE